MRVYYPSHCGDCLCNYMSERRYSLCWSCNSEYTVNCFGDRLVLQTTKKTDSRLTKRMSNHYSKPKGFVGRNICYAVLYEGAYYGHIVAGSATRFLKGRNEFLGILPTQLNNVINNIFYNISKINNKYPLRNFTTKVVECFIKQAAEDWQEKYNDNVIGFETLIEKPRKGELYKKAGWEKVGETIGYTCKRIAGKGTDSWSGKRIWDTKNLKPKDILCIKVNVNNRRNELAETINVKNRRNLLTKQLLKEK